MARPVASRASISARARRIHETSIIIDGMNNSRMTGPYFDQIRRAGITCTMWPVSITAPFRQAIRQICDFWNLVDKNKDKVLIVQDASDVLRAKKEGKLGIVMVIEDTRQLEDDVDNIRIFHRLGVRRMQLNYSTQNSVGCGKGDREGHDAGLSGLGVRVIQKMEEVGMLIDLCHCSPKTLRDAYEVTKKPAVVSHINVKGGYAHPGNLTDAEQKMVKKNGGVIGISGVPFYVKDRMPTIDDMIDHIDCAKRVAGVDAVGVGTAIFEGHPPEFYYQFNLPEDRYGKPPWTWPKGIETIEKFPAITEKLLQRGYTDAEVKKIMGENFLRVFRQVWG